MQVGLPKEISSTEKRIALLPKAVAELTAQGLQIIVEKDLGVHLGFSNDAYKTAGALIHEYSSKIFGSADVIIRVGPTTLEELKYMNRDAMLLGFTASVQEEKLVQEAKKKGVGVLSFERIPKIPRAMEIDAKAAQDSLTGYSAAILAAEKSGRVFPLMMTAAGVISPTRVLVIGAGDAALQAMATARRLGANVNGLGFSESMNEKIHSVGAKPVVVNFEGISETDPVPLPLADVHIENLEEFLSSYLQEIDVLITAADYGINPLQIITKKSLAAMKNETVVIDVQNSFGGNLLDFDESDLRTKIYRAHNLSCRYALNASELFSRNIVNFILRFWNHVDDSLLFKEDEDIFTESLLAYHGKSGEDYFAEENDV